MIKRYKTDFSNEVHQLIVSPSRHYYVTQKGVFKYQKKPFDIKLEKIGQVKRTHTIHYLIRDHFSGLFYWEICASSAPIPIHDFLFRAWSQKQDHPLLGLPVFMTVPKNVQSYFPGIIGFIEKLGITYLKVTSGFQGGVRDLRTIEDRLAWAGFDPLSMYSSSQDPKFDAVLKRMPVINERFYDDLIRNPSKKDSWLLGMNPEIPISVPKSMEVLEELYLSAKNESK